MERHRRIHEARGWQPKNVVSHESSLVSFVEVRLDALPVVATRPSSQAVKNRQLNERRMHELAEGHLAERSGHEAPVLRDHTFEERVQNLMPRASVETW